MSKPDPNKEWHAVRSILGGLVVMPKGYPRTPPPAEVLEFSSDSKEEVLAYQKKYHLSKPPE